MMQVAGEGEACASKIIPLIEGLTTNTAWDRTFTARACWWKTLKTYPEIMNPVKAKNNEDRHIEWFSYKNIKDWTARAKEFRLHIKMASDVPGIIREYSC
jgi:hypothetical protein